MMPNADDGDFYDVDGNDCDDVAGDDELMIALARNILGTRNLSEILAEREDIGDHMHKVLTMMMMRRRMVMMMVTTYKRFLDRKFGFNCISKSVKVSQGQYLTDMVTLCFLTKMEFVKCFTLERFTTF